MNTVQPLISKNSNVLLINSILQPQKIKQQLHQMIDDLPENILCKTITQLEQELKSIKKTDKKLPLSTSVSRHQAINSLGISFLLKKLYKTSRGQFLGHFNDIKKSLECNQNNAPIDKVDVKLGAGTTSMVVERQSQQKNELNTVLRFALLMSQFRRFEGGITNPKVTLNNQVNVDNNSSIITRLVNRWFTQNIEQDILLIAKIIEGKFVTSPINDDSGIFKQIYALFEFENAQVGTHH